MAILDDIAAEQARARALRRLQGQYGGFSETAQTPVMDIDYETGRDANPEDYTPYNPFSGRPGDDATAEIQDEDPYGLAEPGEFDVEPAKAMAQEEAPESADISMPPPEIPSELSPGVPMAQPPPVSSQRPVPPLIMRGGGQARPPSVFANPFPQEDETADMIRRGQYMFAADPTAQTEAAVAAALRFQAVRQYQQDISRGRTPAEAFARSAPLMFSGPKGNASQATALMRALGPQKPIDIGGVGYKQGPNGELIPITPPKSNAFDVAEYHSILAQIAATQKELDDMGIDDKEAGPKRAKLQFLREQLKAIRQRGASLPPQPLPGAPRAPAPTVPGPRVTPPPTVAPAAPAGATPRVATKEQFDQLPSGTVYIGTNGRRYRKP